MGRNFSLKSGNFSFIQVSSWIPEHTFVDPDHEIFSMTISPVPLIQKGQLSGTGESMGTEYWLTV